MPTTATRGSTPAIVASPPIVRPTAVPYSVRPGIPAISGVIGIVSGDLARPGCGGWRETIGGAGGQRAHDREDQDVGGRDRAQIGLGSGGNGQTGDHDRELASRDQRDAGTDAPAPSHPEAVRTEPSRDELRRRADRRE